MADTNSTHSLTNPTNPAWVDQSTTQAGGEVTPGPSPSTAEAAAVQAEAEAAFEPPPIPGTGSPEWSEPIPAASFQQSSRVWRSGNPHYPSKPTNDEHWKKVYGKADQFDAEFCKGWNSEIDALLTFAGLFSAVVTAFAAESYKLLQPDPQDMTNRILLNVSAQLAGGNATELPSGFTPSSSSIRINVLWFLSLTSSLTAGLVGILCKQWLRHYQQDISKPPREALAIRQFRYDALLRCGVMDILSVLPILLGVGLVLFFVGLIDFLQGLNVMVLIPVTTLIGLGFVFLVVTTSAPAFQYMALIQHYSLTGWYIADTRSGLFAFKSPQSLAILHFVTWLYPPSAGPKFPSWASLELMFFSRSDRDSTLRLYTGRALTWLDETYSHSLDMVRQISICLQDTESDLTVEGLGDTELQNVSKAPGAAAIKSLFNASQRPGANEAEGHARRDIIAIRYLLPFAASFDQYFAISEHLIRALNSTHHEIPSLESIGWMISHAFIWAHTDSTEQLQELTWQKAILFRNLLSEGRWPDSSGIPEEVRNVFRNLQLFADEDLDSIFSVLRTWIDQHPQDADLPSRCWTVLALEPKPHVPDETLQHRPPARDFMAFLDSRFQIDSGVAYLCRGWYKYREEGINSFFMALYAWISRNPQDTQSFIRHRAFLKTWTILESSGLQRVRRYRSFRDFEAFLEVQIARNGDVVEGP